MAIHDLSGWRHEHAFDAGNRAGERRTWIVVALTAVAMVGEIVAGWLTNSMALLADGWHMATHVVALSVAGVAYWLARRWSEDHRFAFGTWKIEVLGAFTSALLLMVVALAMVVESVQRLVNPQAIQFEVALIVAAIGLAVNLLSAWVLHGGSSDGHDRHGHDHHGHDHHGDDRHGHDHHGHDHHGHNRHGHDHHGHDRHGHDHHDRHAHEEHGHEGRAHGARREPAGGHQDLNLRSAYVHVIADALTSVFAIVALAAGLWAGWGWLDPVMGIVGAIVIAWWGKGLIAQSARVLLDREMDAPVVTQVRAAIQTDGDAEIADLHVWRVGRASYAAVVTVVPHEPLTPAAYRARLAGIPALAHVSVEVNRCAHRDCP